MAENRTMSTTIECLIHEHVKGTVRTQTDEEQKQMIQRYVDRMEAATKDAYEEDKRAQRESLNRARTHRLD